MSDEKRERSWKLSGLSNHWRVGFDAGYDAATADNAERVKELERELESKDERFADAMIRKADVVLELSRERDRRVERVQKNKDLNEVNQTLAKRAEALESQLAEARATIERLEHAHCIEGDYTGEDAPLALALVRLGQVVKQYSEQVRGLKTEVQQLEAGFIHYTERAEARISELDSQLGHTGERADMVRGKPVKP